MNALELYRKQNSLTFEALAAKSGRDKPLVWKHCRAKRIPAEAAVHYEEHLGIPRWMMRPDLWPVPGPPQHVSVPPEAPTGT
jgi:hypothetical protein